MNEYIEKLGFDTSLYHFVDVFATEEWALAMIPQPVAAVLFLYPLTEVQRQHNDSLTTTTTRNDNNNNPLWFIHQRIGNACGTIGLLHALLNAHPALHVRPESWLDQFQTACPRGMHPDQKAQILEADARIATLHDQATSSARSATSRGNLEDRIENHFVALVCADGGGGSTPSTLNDPSPTNNSLLYELDGRRAGPLLHGSTCPETLLPDACRVIRKYMDRDPTEIRFTILALAPRVEPWT